jgi:hypothetical protein
MIDPTLDPKAILEEATREAADLVGLFGADAPDRATLFDAMEQHARTVRLAALRSEDPTTQRNMNRAWGEALLQRQLLRLTFALADRGVRAHGVADYPAECKAGGKLNATAAMAHAFGVLIDAMERHSKEPT